MEEYDSSEDKDPADQILINSGMIALDDLAMDPDAGIEEDPPEEDPENPEEDPPEEEEEEEEEGDEKEKARRLKLLNKMQSRTKKVVK